MLSKLQSGLGYHFKDSQKLLLALTHSSYAHENSTDEFNERLEFLGDAVLELVISDWLFRQNPGMQEGMLTKRRASLVCEPSLAAIARGVSLGDCLKLGRGESHTGGRERDSLLSDALEAVFGAVYLDGGIEEARGVIERLFQNVSGQSAVMDYKTSLQEILQKNGGESAVYDIIKESGPSHLKEFIAQVSHEGKTLGTGKGRSKKEAEQNAAMSALSAIANQLWM